MVRVLYRLFRSLFRVQIEEEKASAVFNALENDQVDRHQRRLRAEEIELSQFIGRPLVYVGNELENPVVGFGERIEYISKARNPILVVRNYITNTEVMIMGTPRIYTPSVLHMVYTVRLQSLIDFLYHPTHSRETYFKPSEPLLSLPMVFTTLSRNGFYKRLENYESIKFSQSQPGDLTPV